MARRGICHSGPQLPLSHNVHSGDRVDDTACRDGSGEVQPRALFVARNIPTPHRRELRHTRRLTVHAAA